METYEHDVWFALGDPTRRAIFARVAERPCAVVELADGMPVSRPAVSQHLKILKATGLVVDEAVGNRRIYRADAAGLTQLRADLDRFWGSTLAAFKTAVEHPDQEDS